MLFSHRSDSENKNTQDSSMKKYQKASMYCSFYKINIFLFVENSNQEIWNSENTINIQLFKTKSSLVNFII